MARGHFARDRQVHPRGRLTYALAEIGGGPWPGRLAIASLPRSEDDFDRIAEWRADLVLSLVEEIEAPQPDGRTLSDVFGSAGIRCLRAPIADFDAPDAMFEAEWPATLGHALAVLNEGGRVVAHCRGGKGRSGMIAAALLIAGGMAPADAIAEVRRSRPAAIETARQERWLLACAATAAD